MTATILRHRRRANFTVLPNEALRDASLSFRATGLLAYLLSLPEGSSIDSLTLSKRKPEGRDAIRTAFRELEEAGYVRRSKEKNDQNQWQTVTEISDQRIEPGPGNPASGSQATDSRASGGQALSVKNREQEPGQEPPLPPKGGVAKVDDSDFDAFYARYPRKVGKPAAKRAWKAARKKASADAIAAGLDAWMPYWQAKNDMELVPHPSTWLNQERWNDIPPPIAVKNLSAAQSVAEKKQRLFGTGGS